MTNFDDRALEIVRNYITEHLDKSDPTPDFQVFTVWKCKTLQNWKYLLSSTLVKTATVMRATEEAMDVIDYLNSQTGSHYRHTKGNIRHVTARLNEGFTVQDCKTVIDKKCAEWMPDDRMQQYLRPETLFGPKFENYLNQRVVNYSSDRSGQGRKEISLPDYMNRPQPGPEEDPDLLAELLEWQRKNGGET